MHNTATEIFYVRSGTLSIFFDEDDNSAASSSALRSNSTAAASASAPHAMTLHELRAHDSVTIPPKRWHRMANLHDTTLELVYATLFTP